MIKRLISIKLISFISSVGKKRGKSVSAASYSKAKLAGYIAIYLFVFATFASLSAMIAYTVGSLFVPMGFDSLYFGLFMTAALSIIFILSIFETKSELFECKDNDLLLSMPIKPRHIVISRIFTVLIYNYVECAIIMLPAIVVYGLLGGSVQGIVGSVLVLLLIPLLATSLSAGVGYLVALVSKKLKRNSLFTTALSLAFLLAYFFGYQSLLDGVDSLAEMSPEMALALAENLGFFGIIGSAALLKAVPFVILVILSVGAAAIAYFVISSNYISIVTGNKGASHAAYKAKKLNSKTPFAALALKEIRGFLSSSAYMLNAGLGLVFCVMVGVLVLINKNELLSALPIIPLIFADVTDPHAFLSAIVPSAIITVLSMNFISSAALSLEGKRLWVIKSMPLSGRVVLGAKLMPHIIVSLPVSLITSVLFVIALEPPVIFIPFIIVTPIVGVIFFALFGGVIGALMPKFDYENQVQVIKQSALSFVAMFGSMIFGLGSVALCAVLSMVLSPVLASLLLLLALIVLCALLAYILFGCLAKKYDRIEA
ncbi:MAG: hypothetical protein J6B48_09000 [Clostridia bacterium]|nr:hypothetical protein [Clostridia bacterium]